MIRVNARYVMWAHEPAAEDGHAPAEKLCQRCDNLRPKDRGMVCVPLTADDEIRELRSVAEIYEIKQDDDDPSMRRVAKSILNQLREAGIR